MGPLEASDRSSLCYILRRGEPRLKVGRGGRWDGVLSEVWRQSQAAAAGLQVEALEARESRQRVREIAEQIVVRLQHLVESAGKSPLGVA